MANCVCVGRERGSSRAIISCFEKIIVTGTEFGQGSGTRLTKCKQRQLGQCGTPPLCLFNLPLFLSLARCVGVREFAGY